MKTVITYGTYDLLHQGHVHLFETAKSMGDYLIVAVSTDEFNKIKNKTSYHNYDVRRKMVEALKCVDLVIPEKAWEQKLDDIKKYNVDTVVMGDDWAGRKEFESLKEYCNVEYIKKIDNMSTSRIKKEIKEDRPISTIKEISVNPINSDNIEQINNVS